MTSIPTILDIYTAQRRTSGIIKHTPLLSSTLIDRKLPDASLRFKAENLQRTGSFKIRGAFNKVTEILAQNPVGIVTASSGNHGQAVAWAGKHYQMPVHIVVPETAPASKVLASQGYGATVEYCGTTSLERIERAQSLAHQNNWVYIPPFDDPQIIAGQGTIGLEILADWPEVHSVLVPIGGGGLISGIAIAIKSLRPDITLIGVEPIGAAKAWESRRQGHRITLNQSHSIADGLKTSQIGELNDLCISTYVDEIHTVTEAEIIEAFWLMTSRLKAVIEPSGAAAAAFAFSHPDRFTGQNVVAIISGGNVGRGTFSL